MERQEPDIQPATRRSRCSFLGLCLALPAPFVLAACTGQAGTGARSAATPATPAPENPMTAPSGGPTAAPATSSATAPAAPTTTPAVAASSPGPTTGPAQAPTAAGSPVAAQATVLSPTPAACDDDDLTPAQTEGPYFTPNSPERASLLEPGVTGTKLVLTGYIVTRDCQPIARALVDFWQADDRGEYDNRGYRLRGHLFTDQNGFYRLETIVPGLYPGRTRHIHVKVQAPNRPVLTTQLYFPSEPRNQSDRIFHPDLVMAVQDTPDGQAATFTFVRDA